ALRCRAFAVIAGNLARAPARASRSPPHRRRRARDPGQSFSRSGAQPRGRARASDRNHSRRAARAEEARGDQADARVQGAAYCVEEETRVAQADACEVLEPRVTSPFPSPPPNMPRLAPSAAGDLCRWIYTSCGWRVAGEIPDAPKLVVIVAPHSTNWDVIWGLLLKVGLRLDIRFIGKRQAFFWPLGSLLRSFGGIPIDRSAAHGVVGEMAGLFAQQERLWLALAPEGTR